jgi:DNA topoisomerase-3
MGRAVAAALGAPTRRIGYLEGASDLVTWCVGHLVELDAPEAYNPAWKHWRLADLPLCPASFTYHPAESTRDQFNVITAPQACRREHSRQRRRRRAEG